MMDDESWIGGRNEGEPIADMDDQDGNYVRTPAMGRIPATLVELSNPAKETIVSVVWSKMPMKRRGFHTHICVIGHLQQHPDRAQSYRVLIDRATYAYLHEDDVVAIMGRPNVPFKDGSHAVIYIA